jgi:prepilin-type N-terminal cleavage/methylation domain-containing protein
MKTRRGYTLVEVLILVAIVGILSTIALASYQQYHLRKNCRRGRYEFTGATVCSSSSPSGHYCERYEPEKRFICDQPNEE